MAIVFLVLATVLYGGYNVLMKASGSAVPAFAQTTVLATIFLQLAALGTSCFFVLFLKLRGVEQFSLNPSTLLWAAAAGVCIGGAEISYLYLFGGIGDMKPMPASLAIPVIVGGSIIIALFAASLVFGEALAWPQLMGSTLVIAGIALLSYTPLR